MAFTVQQIKEIRDKLIEYGKRDSTLPYTSIPLSGLEEITFIQSGHNVRMRLTDLVDHLLIPRSSDFTNLSDTVEDEMSLEQAITTVPGEARKLGAVVTFLDSSTHTWVIYQFQGSIISNWLRTDLWTKALGGSSGSAISNVDGGTATSIYTSIPGFDGGAAIN